MERHGRSEDSAREIIARLMAALNKALDDPSVCARFVELGSTVPDAADRGPAGLERLVASEVAQIGPLIIAAGVDAELSAQKKTSGTI